MRKGRRSANRHTDTTVTDRRYSTTVTDRRYRGAGQILPRDPGPQGTNAVAGMAGISGWRAGFLRE